MESLKYDFFSRSICILIGDFLKDSVPLWSKGISCKKTPRRWEKHSERNLVGWSLSPTTQALVCNNLGSSDSAHILNINIILRRILLVDSRWLIRTTWLCPDQASWMTHQPHSSKLDHRINSSGGFLTVLIVYGSICLY